MRYLLAISVILNIISSIKEKIYYENGWFIEGYSYDTKGNLIATHHGNRDMILTKPVE